MARRFSAGRRPRSPATTRTQRRLPSSKARHPRLARSARYKLFQACRRPEPLRLRQLQAACRRVISCLPVRLGLCLFRSSRIPLSACRGPCSTLGNCKLRRNLHSKAAAFTRITSAGGWRAFSRGPAMARATAAEVRSLSFTMGRLRKFSRDTAEKEMA
jgi:hypothetical protein